MEHAAKVNMEQPDSTHRSVLLTEKEIASYSKKSQLRFGLDVMLEFLTIALAAGLSIRMGGAAIYLVAVILIGSRLHALAILMHEAVHGRGLGARMLNEIVGELLAFAVSLSMTGFRQTHLAHHRALNTGDDPDWTRKKGDAYFEFPKTRFGLACMVLKCALGIKFVEEYIVARSMRLRGRSGTALQVARGVALLAIVVSSLYWGFWSHLLLYWVVPLCTSFFVFRHIRSVAEHFCLVHDHGDPYSLTRTVVASPFELWLIAPHGMNYHLEHHLFPGVPYFRLGALHRYLMKNPEYRQTARVTRGYVIGLIKECREFSASHLEQRAAAS